MKGFVQIGIASGSNDYRQIASVYVEGVNFPTKALAAVLRVLADQYERGDIDDIS